MAANAPRDPLASAFDSTAAGPAGPGYAIRSAQWLFLGPALALLISTGSWFVFEYFSPGKLAGIGDMIRAYPRGLLMSLLTPWGWLMYGGALLLFSGRSRRGMVCTVVGAVILGAFWPVWSTFILGR